MNTNNFQKGSHNRTTEPDLLTDDFKSSLNKGLPTGQDIKSIFSHNDHLTSFNLVISISAKLAGNTKFAAVCIKDAIRKNAVSNVELLAQVKMMIEDNDPAMVEMLGEELTDKIKMFEI